VHPERVGAITDAEHVLVRDVESGMTLFSVGEGVSRRTASITKLLSALVLTELPSWQPDEIITVSPDDVRVGGRWYTPFGAPITRRDALQTMLVASGNNETMALVRQSGVPFDAFVARMNARAQTLGMEHSSFADPVGLSDDNRAPVEDVALLLDAALASSELEPFLHKDEARIQAGGEAYRWPSTDALLSSFLNVRPYAVLGGKTGSLDGGYSLAVRVEREGHPIDIIVLEAGSPAARFADAKALAVWAFDVFAWE
jgi:D-alanyl-D-alanine endopeptidase (penicillin-binding protein 7)